MARETIRGEQGGAAGEVVRFEGVSLSYGKRTEILRDIHISLPAGSFHFLTGPSGAGKSSLLALMYLALRPTSGTIRLFGVDTARAARTAIPEVRRRIGVVFQDFRLLEHLTTFENVALPLRVSGVAEREIRRNVREMLDWVGLRDEVNARPSTLSGGQQQRAAIARAVVAHPELLLADEPTGSVDEPTALRLMRLFEELNRMGTAVLIATHNAHLVESFGYPALLLDGGTLAAPVRAD